MKVLADRSISGSGDQWGVADAGITDESTWPYESDPIGTNEARTPPPFSRRPYLYRSVRWANTRGEVLRTDAKGASLVRQLRYLVSKERVPVVVGLALFPSINNPNTRRTGMVTLPFSERPTVAMRCWSWDTTIAREPSLLGTVGVRDGRSRTLGKSTATQSSHMHTLSGILSAQGTPCEISTDLIA